MMVHLSRIIQLLLIALLFLSSGHAWEWSDFVSGGAIEMEAAAKDVTNTLTFDEVSAMKVRDIKWRLARTHGFSADEIGRMIDKKDLIEALAFEEEKIRIKNVEKLQRTLLQRGVMWGIGAIAIIIFWPLIQQGKEVAQVNIEVYYDRKTHEARRCWELKSTAAMIGVAIMFALDLLQLWLSASVLLSWFISRNKYFFPIPHIPVRPAQFMGNEMNKAFGGYGLNIGSMAVTWVLRFCHAQTEAITARFMLAAQKKLRKERKSSSGSRSTSKKAKSKASQKNSQPPPSEIPADSQPTNTTDASYRPVGKYTEDQKEQDDMDDTHSQQTSPQGSSSGHADTRTIPISNEHLQFLGELGESSPMDDLD